MARVNTRRHRASWMSDCGPRTGCASGCRGVESGQRSIEHPHKLRLAVSSLEEQTVVERIANPIDGAARLQTDFSRLKRIVESYDERRATELFKLLVRNGTWVTPTLVNVQTRPAHAGDDDYRKDPRFRYMPVGRPRVAECQPAHRHPQHTADRGSENWPDCIAQA